MIGTVVISDRGDKYLPACLHALETLGIKPNEFVFDDDHKLGMSGAVNAAWQIATDEGWDYLFHVEEDFIINDAPLTYMANTLAMYPHLASMVLKRQPVNELEHEHGDQLAAICSLAPHRSRSLWTEHKHLFSLNPCLIPRRIFSRKYPAGNEAAMSDELRDDHWFGVWGHVDDAPRCFHIGHERSAGWRL